MKCQKNLMPSLAQTSHNMFFSWCKVLCVVGQLACCSHHCSGRHWTRSYNLLSHVYQLLKNPPDDEIRILHSVVLPAFLDSNAELDSVSLYKGYTKDIIPASKLESFAPLVDSQDDFIPESAPL
jgi:hypothetical protein